MNIHIHNYSYFEVVSGGDAIAAEFGKAWHMQGHSVTIFTHNGAKDFFLSRGIALSSLSTTETPPHKSPSVLAASIISMQRGITTQWKRHRSPVDIIFSSSCMYEDLLPALMDKFRHPKARLVVGIYLFPVAPWKGAYGSTMLNRYIFWAMYHSGILLSRLFAQFIWTASDLDAERVRTKFHKPSIAIRGGVDLKLANFAHAQKTTYDALCLGRFHPQKNPLELIAIWKHVVQLFPQATLAFCGAGFMEQPIRNEITRLELTQNVYILEPKDGEAKYDLYKSAKLFVSSSHFDTGNLALDESLACSIPAVVYDTSYQRENYPQGVVKVPCFSIDSFARTVVDLLTDHEKRIDLGKHAYALAESLSWTKQAAVALDSLR